METLDIFTPIPDNTFVRLPGNVESDDAQSRRYNVLLLVPYGLQKRYE